MELEEQKQHGVTVGSEIKRESCVIADQAGASIRRACEVIATHLEKDSLKAADMALRIHDGYPSEKREVTLKGGLSVTHLSDEELDNALTELDEIESDE